MVGRRAMSSPPECFTDPPYPALEADPAVEIDAADIVSRSVVDGRQHFGIGPFAHAIALGGHREIERFMRALVVVDRPPAIEGMLAMGEIGEALAAEHLGLERAV